MSDISSVKVIDEALEKLKDREEEKEANDKQLESVKKVLVLKEKKSGDILEIISGEVIGRAAKGSQLFFKLDNPKVISRLHCQIFFKDDKWYIRDMDSTNNTFLNGNKLESAKEYELKEGDIINLAGVIDFEII
ncbi:MAG: FHA domain-containing protein [bacterium]